MRGNGSQRGTRTYALVVAALVAGAVVSALQVSYGQTAPAAPAAGAGGGGGGRGGGGRGGRGPIADPSEGLVNLAVVATPSTSYVSGDQKIEAINDGIFNAGRGGAGLLHYGNWPRGGTQWVEYTWSKPISTNRVDVLWWADGAGIHLPKASRVKYWDGSKYIEVANAKGLGVEGNTFNVTTFDEVTTPRIRLEFDAEGGNQVSTGLTEFRVFDSGKSPAFAPMVHAGMERVMILGGKTFLDGSVKAVSATGAELMWSKGSGPGTVSFASPSQAVTTATFSSPGDYELMLTGQIGDLSNSDSLKVRVVEPPPVIQLDAVNTETFKVDSPLWNSRVKALICSWIPHCVDEINNSSNTTGGIDNFVEAGKKLAGQPAAQHKGYPFSNAWVHQTVESMSIACMVDPQGDKDIIEAQAKMKATLDQWIPIILAAQEPDGYLQTRFTLDPRNPQHWSPQYRTEHEGYTAGYFLESAINHYNMTDHKDARMYNAAKKLADCWVANIGPGKKDWYDGHQEMEQALVRFGRFVNSMEGKGKGQKYIDLAKFLLDSRRGGSEYDQSHVPVIQQYEAVGHAVRAAYTYSGMADVAVETHNVDYQSAVMSLWDNVVNKKWYVTGGIGSGETSEGFGPNYSLRNDAYCESCSTCGEIFFQYKLNLAYQDSKYADLYEDSLYNALLGSVDMKGTVFNYTNPLIGGNRTAWHNCPCCVGNIPRTLLMIPTWAYARSADSIYVNLYIGSTATIEDIAGTSVQMVQKTDYPWSGKVSITVNPAVEKNFTLKVRVPNRDVSTLYTSTPVVKGINSFALNGAASNPTVDKGYITISRDWKKGDKIDLDFPMAPQRIKASDKIAADAGRVALRYGPLIYNVESVDLADRNVDRVLAPDSPLKVEWKPDLFKAIGDAPEGVMAITGTFADGTPMMAIPNYARLNRTVTGTNAAGGGGGRRGGRGGAFGSSIVWIRDQ